MIAKYLLCMCSVSAITLAGGYTIGSLDAIGTNAQFGGGLWGICVASTRLVVVDYAANTVRTIPMNGKTMCQCYS